MVADGTTGPDDLAVASLPVHDAALLVGRDGRAFRRRERAQLVALAGIADRTWALLALALPRIRVGSKDAFASRWSCSPATCASTTIRRWPRAARDAELVVPLFVFDDAILAGSFNCPNRTGFLLESLADLDRRAATRGAGA